jgi:hypothetical protein
VHPEMLVEGCQRVIGQSSRECQPAVNATSPGSLRGPLIAAKVAVGYCRGGAQGAHRGSAAGTRTEKKMPTGPMCDPWWH